MADWTPAEIADAGRDALAMVRASADGRTGDIGAILDGAGDRGTRCTAEVLASLAADLAVRLTVAVSAIEDGQVQELVSTASHNTLLAEPGIRAALDANLAGLQAAIA